VKNYVIDHDHGTISPIAPGQRFMHREYEQPYTIKTVKYQDDGRIQVEIDPDHSWDSFAWSAIWESEHRFFMFLKFKDWAYNGPVKIDTSRWPHKCPRCAKAAYVGACGGGDVDCTNPDCPTRKR
jgi:hypothetical protein